MYDIITACKDEIREQFHKQKPDSILLKDLDIDDELEEWPIGDPDLSCEEIFSTMMFHPGLDRITIRGTIAEETITVYATYSLEKGQVESVYFDTGEHIIL